MPMPQPQSQPQSQPSPGAVVVGVDHAPHGGSSAAASDDGYAEEYNEGSEEGEGEAFTAADARAERRRDGRLHGYQAPVAREKGVSQASNRRVKQRRAYSLPRLPFHHAGLLVAECGKCANCQDMLKFGGQGLRKRSLIVHRQGWLSEPSGGVLILRSIGSNIVIHSCLLRMSWIKRSSWVKHRSPRRTPRRCVPAWQIN
jgi:hypothetical protein